MSTSNPAESGNEPGARCVLWHSPDHTPPTALLGALARRGFGVRAVQSQFGAMAELCLLERRPSASMSPHFVLLLVEPETLEGRSAVLEGMRRYAPGGVTWVYEPGANKPLREYVEEVEPVKPVRSSPRVRPGHELRLAGDGPLLDAVEDHADKADDGLGHLLSDEELAMLLDQPGARAAGSADGD